MGGRKKSPFFITINCKKMMCMFSFVMQNFIENQQKNCKRRRKNWKVGKSLARWKFRLFCRHGSKNYSRGVRIFKNFLKISSSADFVLGVYISLRRDKRKETKRQKLRWLWCKMPEISEFAGFYELNSEDFDFGGNHFPLKKLPNLIFFWWPVILFDIFSTHNP